MFMGYYSYQGGRDMKKVLRKMIEICACRMVRNRLMAEAMKKSSYAFEHREIGTG